MVMMIGRKADRDGSGKGSLLAIFNGNEFDGWLLVCATASLQK